MWGHKNNSVPSALYNSWLSSRLDGRLWCRSGDPTPILFYRVSVSVVRSTLPPSPRATLGVHHTSAFSKEMSVIEAVHYVEILLMITCSPG